MGKLIMSTPTPSIAMSPYLRDALRLLDGPRDADFDVTQNGEERFGTTPPGYAGLGVDRVTLTALLRLSHALAGDDLSGVIQGRGAMTVIETRDPDLVGPCETALRGGLFAAAEATSAHAPNVTLFSHAAAGPDAVKFHRNLAKAVAEPGPVVVVTDRLEAIPGTFREAVTRHVELPDLDGRLLLEHIKIVHPRGKIDEDALLAAMPDGARLARLSTAQLVLALRRPSRHAVVNAIRDMTGRDSADRSYSSLDRIRGLGPTRTLMQQLVADLHDWRAGVLAWRDVPRGLLLHGPPGTGKTASVRALAQDAGVHLQCASMAGWQAAGHLGEMLRAMRADFEQARQNAPAILFIDEIDSVADRSTVAGHNATYDVAATNALLEQLDGIDLAEGMLVIAACNAPDRLDRALTRSGRFDLRLEIGLPDQSALREMLGDMLGDKLDGAVLDEAAERLVGHTGADVAAVVRSALARRRAQGRRSKLLPEDLKAALMLHVADRPNRALWRTAVHEAGHVLALSQTGRGLPARVEIGPKGGRVVAPPPLLEETLGTLENELVVLLAGRAAEGLMLGCASAAAGGEPTSDLARATRLATLIDSSLGLGRNGPIWIDPNLVCLSADRELRDSVRERLARAEAAAGDLVAADADRLERIAQALFASRSLDRPELAALLDQGGAGGPVAEAGEQVTASA